jgi:hypothetical protein
MSKMTIALVSFIFGACTAFVSLGGTHTSTFAQTPPTPTPPSPLPPSFFGFPSGLPRVPGITSLQLRDLNLGFHSRQETTLRWS